jgi:hypothetical protein
MLSRLCAYGTLMPSEACLITEDMDAVSSAIGDRDDT